MDIPLNHYQKTHSIYNHYQPSISYYSSLGIQWRWNSGTLCRVFRWSWMTICSVCSTKSMEVDHDSHLVGGIPTPLKNMKVSWDHYSQYMWIYESHKSHVPNHQPHIYSHDLNLHHRISVEIVDRVWHFLLWWKRCHKPPMTGNGKHTTYENADDWGMVYEIVWPTLLQVSKKPLLKLTSSIANHAKVTAIFSN